MKFLTRILLGFILIITISNSFSLNASDTKKFKWENTVIEVPVFANISDYKDKVKSTLYVNGIKSDMEITALPDNLELARIDTSHIGSYKVHYGAVCDDRSISVRCGRICIVTFNIRDKEAPSITVIRKNISIYYASKLNKEDVLSCIEYYDNYTSLSELSVSVDISNVNTYISDTYNAYLKISDSSSNTSFASIKVFVIRETIPPSVILLVDKLVYYIGNPIYKDLKDFISVSDNETSKDNIDITYSTNLNYYVEGDYTINYVVYDFAGNMTKKTLEVTVKKDDVSPSVIYDNLVYNIDYGSTITKEYLLNHLSISDNVSSLDEINIRTERNIDTLVLGERKVTVIVSDALENKTFVIITINVIPDTVPPTLLIKGDAILNSEAVKDFKYDDYYTVSDNNTKVNDITIEILNEPNLCLEGTYYVNITARDSFNNKSTAILKIVVLESVYKPTINLDINELVLEITSSFSEEDFLSHATVVGYNKNKNTPDILFDFNDLKFHKPGNYTVYYSIEEPDYNYKTSLKVLVKEDDVPPEIKPLFNSPFMIRYSSKIEDVLTVNNFVFSDNFSSSDDLIVYLNLETINFCAIGLSDVEISCADENSNIKTFVFQVLIFDDVSPVVTYKVDVNNLVLSVNSLVNLSDYLTVIDEFDGNITNRIEGLEEIDFSQIGNYFVNLQVFDSSRNKTSFSINLRIVDDEKPTLVLRGTKLNYFYDTEFSEEFFKNLIVEASDNYDKLTKEDVEIDFSSIKKTSGEYTVYYTLFDKSLNTVKQELIIYLYTLTPPKITINNPTVFIGSSFNVLDYVEVEDPSYERIYDSILVSNLENLDLSRTGIYSLTVTVTNSSNCTSKASMLVTVKSSTEKSNLTSDNISYIPDSSPKNTFLSDNIEIIILASLVIVFLIVRKIYCFIKNKPKDDEL